MMKIEDGRGRGTRSGGSTMQSVARGATSRSKTDDLNGEIVLLGRLYTASRRPSTRCCSNLAIQRMLVERACAPASIPLAELEARRSETSNGAALQAAPLPRSARDTLSANGAPSIVMVVAECALHAALAACECATAGSLHNAPKRGLDALIRRCRALLVLTRVRRSAVLLNTAAAIVWSRVSAR